MRNLFRSLFIVLCVSMSIGAADAARWSKTYAVYPGSYLEAAEPTADGGYVAVGGAPAPQDGGDFDAWIMKLDASGNVTWQQVMYSGTSDDNARSVLPTKDGGYIVTGRASTAGGFVLKLDANGNTAWQRSYGAADVLSARQTQDGKYVMFLSPNLLLKVDADGNIIWQRVYTGVDGLHLLHTTIDGGYVAAGFSMLDAEGWVNQVVKLDQDGNVVWHKTYGGIGHYIAHSIQGTSDGGYIVAGARNPGPLGGDRPFAAFDAWILRLDTSGEIAWQKAYGGADYDEAFSVQQTDDGGYIVVGQTASARSGRFDAWVLKLDQGGNITWQETFLADTYAASARFVRPTFDGGYLLGGEFGPDGWVAKIDANGHIDGCAKLGTSTATAVNTVATAANGDATVAIGNTTVAGSGLSIRNVAITSQQQCYSPGPASGLRAVEYIHGGYGHYFVTAFAPEMATLDTGALNGWRRTGESFGVLPLNTKEAGSVCRFWSAQTYAPKSSHFYTPFDWECANVKSKREWFFEGDVFAARLPDATGACTGGLTPLYRLYNDGKSGAPNHRYTTSAEIQQQMIALGWIPEGQGAGVIGCVPGP